MDSLLVQALAAIQNGHIPRTNSFGLTKWCPVAATCSLEFEHDCNTRWTYEALQAAVGAKEKSSVGTALTVLDVIDGFFAGDPVCDVAKLTDREIREFGDQVQLFYANAVHDTAPDSVYLGGWYTGAPASHPVVMNETLRTLLYYESIVMHDPLAEYFREHTPRLPAMRPIRAKNKQMSITPALEGWATHWTYGSERDNLACVRSSVAQALRQLEQMRPAIAAGIVLPRSVWPIVESRVHQLSSALRHDLQDPTLVGEFQRLTASGEPPLTWDNMRGLNTTPTGGICSGDEPLEAQAALLYVAKSLAIADGTGSRYAPYDTSDFAMFAAKVRQVLSPKGTPAVGELIRAVAGAAVPEFDLPVKDLVEIRKNEDSFASWRAEIRTLGRQYGHLPGDELAEAVKDAMLPRVAEVDAAVKQAGILQRAQSGLTEMIVTGAAAAGAVLLVGGDGPTAAAAAAPSVAGWVKRMFVANKLQTNAEVLTILRARHR